MESTKSTREVYQVPAEPLQVQQAEIMPLGFRTSQPKKVVQKSEFGIVNEKALLRYASELTLHAKQKNKTYVQYQDEKVVLHIQYGTDQKEYTEYGYNQNTDILWYNNSSETRYYNKGDKERGEFLLTYIYELKKLCLEQQQETYVQKLQKGEFTWEDGIDNLEVDNKSSHKKCLEEKINCIDKLIDTLNEQDLNYGRSFGEHVDSFIVALKDLKHFSDESNEAQWDAQVEVFKNESFVENAQSRSSEGDDKEKLQQFAKQCIDLVQSEDFEIESVEQLKNSQEYSELRTTRYKDFFGGLIRDIKRKAFAIRQAHIEGELNKTKFIEGEIRKKQDEIRKMQGDFSGEYQISEKDEKMYKRILKAQQSRTNQEYRDGLSRTKEKTEEYQLKSRVNHCLNDNICGAKDIKAITEAISKEYPRIKAHEEQIANKEQEAVNLKEDTIPSLEVERDLLQTIIEKLKSRLDQLSNQTEECQDLKQKKEKKITTLEADNGRYEVDIKAQYQQLSGVLAEIEVLKADIAGFKTAKDAVREEEESAFKEVIFEQVGGQRSDNYSPDGYLNHKSCQTTLEGTAGCCYKSAVKNSVSFSISKFPSLVSNQELLKQLSGYVHSAVGDAKHQEDILMIPKHVYDSYKVVQKRIKTREDGYQTQIAKNEKTLQAKETARDTGRNNIIEKENHLNEKNIHVSVAEREKENLVSRMHTIDMQIAIIKDYIDVTNSLQSSVSDEIDKSEEEISELMHHIEDKKEKVNEAINKEEEYNQALALSEVKWVYSQYDNIITSFDDLEKQKKEQERLKAEILTIKKELEANDAKKREFNSSLNTTRTVIEKTLADIEVLVHEKNNLITERSLIDRKSQIGLVNTIEVCRKELEGIQKQQTSEIEQMNDTKAKTIKRAVYKAPNLLTCKGTTKTDGDYPEDIGEANQLYKKRRHKDCQDVFNKDNQACKYFDALDIIIKILLATSSKSNEEIFAELKSGHDNYENHVLSTHTTDIENKIEIIRKQIEDFNTMIENLEVKYTNEQKRINKCITDTKEQLTQKKKLDGVIIVKKLASTTEEQDKQNVQDNLDVGVDCIVIDQIEIYTSKKSKMNINEFIQEITFGHALQPMDLTPEVQKFLDTRNATTASIERVLLQKKDTTQKKLYELLVHYFDKIYLKKKLEIVEQLKNQAVLEGKTRDIKREIERIDRENEQLHRGQSKLEHVLAHNTKEIERRNLICQELVTPKAIKRNEIKNYEMMKALCVELLQNEKRENEHRTEKMIKVANKISAFKDFELKIRNKVYVEDFVSNIKLKIFKNRWKIGLHSQIDQHRNCIDDTNDPCNFHEKVAVLIDHTIKKIQDGQIVPRAPDFKVTTDNQNKLIEQLKINEGHSTKHQKALRRIVRYVAEEYGQGLQTKQTKRQRARQKLEWKIANIESEKDASNKHFISKLENQIEKIDNFLTFRKTMLFAGEPLVNEDFSQKELSEYKDEKLNALFNHQLDYLILCMGMVSTRIEFHKSDRELLIGDEAIRSIMKCIYDVFKEYYNDLNSDDLLIRQVIIKLKQELSEDHNASKIKALMRQKSANMGGIEYILKKISWFYQEDQPNYDELLDPEKIYRTLLLKEKQKKETIEQTSLEVLQEEISRLEGQKKELFIKDNALLREELENINTCARYMENAMEVASLRNRTEEIDESRSNKDDYYSFDMDRRRVCVRLLSKDPQEKYAEINRIDRIRSYITEHNSKLLEQKVQKEVYIQELKDEVEKEFKVSFIDIQRKLLAKGISLCGYDTFDNGEPLDRVNSFISLLLGVIIGENSLYQIGGINEASRRVGEWARKIRLKYNKFISSNDATKQDEIIEQDQIRFIANAVNEEFKSDKLFINQITIIENKQNKVMCFGVQQHQQSITLLMHEAKPFVLVPQDKIKLHKDDIQLDVSMKITHMLSMLQTDEDLFKYLCQRRLQDVLRVTLEYSEKLAEHYKREKSSLAKISSLKDFNALFCNMLELSDTSGSPSVSLFAFLTYLEKLDYSIAKEDSKEKIVRLKVVKNLYDKALFTMIKAEQHRRQKNNVAQLKETREELYLKELIKDREGELAELLQEINTQEQRIEEDQNLVNSLLFEKENTRDQHQQKMEQLSNTTTDLKAKLKSTQETITELNKNEEQNQERIRAAQKEIVRLETALAETEKAIKLKEQEKEALEIEINDLTRRKNELDLDLKRVNAEKDRKVKEEAQTENEIELCKIIVKLIQNLQLILATAELQSKKEEIKESIYASNILTTLLDGLHRELEKIPAVGGANFWQLLIGDVNYEQLHEYVESDKTIAGELQHNLVSRLRSVIREAFNIECEIVQELVNGKPIKRFKVLAANISYRDIHSKIKDHAEKEILSSEASRGLNFNEDVLHSSEYGVTGIKELPNELRMLIERRIELHFKSEEVESKKNAKCAEAARIINELRIDYKDVVKCFVDEIEVIASSRFILNDSPSYPGIDLSIHAVHMECVGENLILDTSGQSGKTFRYGASDGSIKRTNNQPRGDKGYDGYDGDHGSDAGNIVISIENTIINLEALTAIKANGGNGGEGQLGGNGDEGSKGTDGKNGEAADTDNISSGQTTIGFGIPGTAGGRGGAPGHTGRPGLGGKAGVIDITHRAANITQVEINPGNDADNILDNDKPSGGIGGEPGLYGMDQVREKSSFFVKTETLYTVIDRAALMEKYPELRKQIIASQNIAGTDLVTEIPISEELVDGDPPVGAFVVKFVGEAAKRRFFDHRLSYEEANNPTDYRNRDRNLEDKRGKPNEEEASLRSDYRSPQQDKREAINIDSLHSKLVEKKREDKEITGEAQYRETINDLTIEHGELASDIEKCTQEASNIQCEMENIGLAKEAKDLELENIIRDISSLRNKESTLDTEKISKIHQVIKAISSSHNLRDKKGMLNLEVEQALAKLEMYNALGIEFGGNKQDLIRIIDEYLEAIQARLRRNRNDLKYLKNNFAVKELDIKILSKKLEVLHHERLAQIVTETEIDQEIEEEVETQHVEEISNVIDREGREVYLKAKYDNKPQTNESSYVLTTELLEECERIESFITQDQNVPEDVSWYTVGFSKVLNKFKWHRKDLKTTIKPKMLLEISDIEFVLKQSVRHYRSGVYDDKKVILLLEAIGKKSEQISSVKGDLKKIIQTYKKEIKKIRTIKNIDTLSTVEIQLTLDYLKKTNFRLERDHTASLSDDKDKEAFMLKMLEIIDKDDQQEQNVAKKLQIRFDGQHLLSNDKLKDDIENLIELIEDRKTFYLEKCAINFTQNSAIQTEYEKTMLAYNQQPNLENLVSLVSQFKSQVSNMEGTHQLLIDYLPKSVEGFIAALVENVRYHGMLLLNEIKESESRNNRNTAELHTRNLIDLLKIIVDNIAFVHTVSPKATELTQVIRKIMEILVLFTEAVKNLKAVTKSKGEENRAKHLLKAATCKLIKYIDIDSGSKLSRGMKYIANHYLDLFVKKSASDMECIHAISEQLEGEEEIVITKTGLGTQGRRDESSKEQKVEEQNVETQNVETQNVERQNVERQNVERQIVKKQIVEGQNLERQNVERQIVEKQIVEGQNLERQNVERQNVEGQNVERQNVERQNIETQNIETQNFETQNVETQNVETQNEEGQNVERQNVERQNVERQNVERQNVERQNVERQNVARQYQKTKCRRTKFRKTVERQNVESQNVEKQNVEGQNVERQNVERQNVEEKNVERQNVEGQNVKRQNVERQNVERQNVETQNVARQCQKKKCRKTVERQNVERQNVERQNVERQNV